MAIRLINTKNLCLEFFMGSNTPQFAILSHTWEGNGEISFQEMLATKDDLDHSSKRKSGFTKIVNTCRKARHDKIDYVWVDTCCIDKTSSSELSEAINSMYRWYQKAIVCYVLLSDFDASLATVEKDLSKCRWFTRGWCLQELIAPQQVEFFDLHWRQIGSKAELGPLISKITRIDENVLVDNSLIQFVPVARRMSWIAGRETTREEDMAYCLLGIFDVSMPMLYGEGTKAFMRLQEEIIKTSNDLSIFAFLHGPALSSTDKSAQIYHDLFAKSPRDFIGCKDLVSATAGAHSNSTFALTNKGLYFRRAELYVDPENGSYSMPLNYKHSESSFATMFLRKVGPNLFARCDDYGLVQALEEKGPGGRKDDVKRIVDAYIITNVTPSVYSQLARAEEYAIHVWSSSEFLIRGLQVLERSVTSDCWDVSSRQFLTRGERSFEGYLKVFPSLTRSAVEGKAGHRSLSGYFYLACGCQHSDDFPEPKAWVRLYSVEEWRAMEVNLGIVSGLDRVLYDMGTSCGEDQITMGKGLMNPRRVTATVTLKLGAGIPRFEVELDFEEGSSHTIITQRPTIKKE